MVLSSPQIQTDHMVKSCACYLVVDLLDVLNNMNDCTDYTETYQSAIRLQCCMNGLLYNLLVFVINGPRIEDGVLVLNTWRPEHQKPAMANQSVCCQWSFYSLRSLGSPLSKR